MNSDASRDQATPPNSAAVPVSVGSLAPIEICAGCHRPLTRRGKHGECLRCLLGFALEADDEPVAVVSPDPPRTAGQTLRYGIFEVAVAADGFPVELGSGAMAITYRAINTVLHHAVALKVINRAVAEHPAARARFLREARAAAKLHHPNVASVSHYGEQDGECYYVMELIEGETLEARVRREGPFSPALTLEVGVQVARALAAAEVCGVVHRDLKPSNLMLTTRQGEIGAPGTFTVKVIDWGLAKAVTAESALGADHTHGGFVGTPAFASPEQFDPATGSRIDTRSDIYSLGVTLWYLLCGRTPFVGRTLEEIHARQVQEPPLEQLAAARVPGRVVTLLRSMVAADPAVRPQSARELLDALHRCQKAYPPGSPTVARRSRRIWLAGVLGLLVLAAAVAGTWGYSRVRTLPMPTDRSVAVLPFENLSPDKADAFFTVGVQDEIAADLARVAALKVIGSESTRSYLPGARDFARIGRELGVTQLLEGSVRRADDQVRVAVRLIDVHDLAHPWEVRYDRHLADVFAVQSEITRAVAARLHAVLAPSETAVLDEPPTKDLAAYDLYLRARAGPKIFQSPGEARRAYASQIPLLEAAVARDPGFALAYCALAVAHDSVQYYGAAATTEEEQTVDHRALAEIALAKARRLRPDVGEVHLAQATHFFRTSHDNEQAQIEVDLARNALPNNAEVEEIAGEIARNQNHWEEAIRCLEKAVALEPRENVNRFTLANTYRLMRRYDESDLLLGQVIATLTPRDSVAYRLFRALGRLEQRADLAPLRAGINAITPADEPNGELKDEYSLILELCAHEPDAVSRTLAATSQSRFLINHVAYPKAWFEALAARMRRDHAGAQTAFAAARIEVDQVVQADTANGRMLSLLAMIDAGLGSNADAVREGRRACELIPVEKASTNAPAVASNLAVVYAWTGQPDLACAVLEEWIKRPAGSNLPAQPTYGDLRLNPLWDPLQGNPRFAALTARLAPQDSK